VAVIYAGTQGYVDKVPTARVREWEAGFVRFLKSERQGVVDEIEEKKALDDALFERLKAAISSFNHQFGVEGYNDVPDPGPGKAAPKAEVKAEPKVQAKPKATPKPAAKKAAAEDDEGASRPSQLDQMRAALDDKPKPSSRKKQE
jgi:ATP synthase alpha/beta subunit-like protein